MHYAFSNVIHGWPARRNWWADDTWCTQLFRTFLVLVLFLFLLFFLLHPPLPCALRSKGNARHTDMLFCSRIERLHSRESTCSKAQKNVEHSISVDVDQTQRWLGHQFSKPAHPHILHRQFAAPDFHRKRLRTDHVIRKWCHCGKCDDNRPDDQCWRHSRPTGDAPTYTPPWPMPTWPWRRW